jgi:hypothetical protein
MPRQILPQLRRKEQKPPEKLAAFVSFSSWLSICAAETVRRIS